MNDIRMRNNKLQESGSSDENTAMPSTTSEEYGGGSACTSIESSSGHGGGWFGGIGSDIRTLAYTIKDNIPPAIGDIAAFVQDSALSMAAEISKLESEETEDHLNIVDSSGYYCGTGGRREREILPQLRLPWEILLQNEGRKTSSRKTDGDCPENNNEHTEDDSIDSTDNDNNNNYVESAFLKEKIFDISYNENNFFQPYILGKDDQIHHDQQEHENEHCHDKQEKEQEEFVLDEPRITLIRRLLEIDQNLASVHARLSGRSDVRETIFWKNYFYHCSKARKNEIKAQKKLNEPQQKEKKSVEVVIEKTIELPKTPDRRKYPKHKGNTPPVKGSDSVVSFNDDSSYVNIATPPASMNSWTDITMLKNNIDFSMHSIDEKNKPAQLS